MSKSANKMVYGDAKISNTRLAELHEMATLATGDSKRYRKAIIQLCKELERVRKLAGVAVGALDFYRLHDNEAPALWEAKLAADRGATATRAFKKGKCL